MIALLAASTRPAGAQATNSAPQYAFSHLAGPLGGYGNADGTGPAARFRDPASLAIDSAGNVYAADPWTGSVRKMTPTGVVTTVLTASSANDTNLLPNVRNLSYTGVAVDLQDNLYVTESVYNLIFKRTPAGTLSIYTGQTGNVQYTSTDGTLAQASFDDPAGMAFDSAGNLYVADSFNHIIRKITPQGMVSTFAGTAPEYGNPHGAGVVQRLSHPGSADGPNLSAQFLGPTAVAVDAAGNLYVADTSNNTIRKISAAGNVTTLAGKAGEEGSTDGAGAVARFRFPSGVAVDPAGNVYVADAGNGTIRKITPSGSVSTLAGVAGEYRSVDGTGGAARFVSPKSVLLDRSGRLLVGDGPSLYNPLDQDGTIRRVTLDGVVTTVAGLAGATGSTDGKGETARFRHPADVAVDAAGNVFVADDLNHTIRKITPDGTTTTFAGTPGHAGAADGPGGTATFNRPTGLAFDASGRLLVADHDNHLIRRIALDGFVTTLAGSAGIAGTTDGAGAAARFHNPVAVAVDGTGNIYVGDGDYFPGSGDPARQFGTIRKLTSAGVVTTLAGDPVIVDYSLTRSNPDGTGPGARFGDATGIAIDADGNLFVADSVRSLIRKVTPAGVVTSLNLTDSSGASVSLHSPVGITRDKDGNLFVTDALLFPYPGLATAQIHRITPTGIMTDVGGIGGIVGSADGVGPAAQFNRPTGLKVDAQGNLTIADTENNAIRRGMVAGAPVITTQPQGTTAAAGASVQFSVTATGIPAPTYQWQFNSSPFQGATGTTLSFTNVRSSDAGDYTVVVTNAVGSVTSAKATLTMPAAPVSPAPTSSSGGGGGGGGAPSLWFLASFLSLGLARSLTAGRRRSP